MQHRWQRKERMVALLTVLHKHGDSREPAELVIAVLDAVVVEWHPFIILFNNEGHLFLGVK